MILVMEDSGRAFQQLYRQYYGYVRRAVARQCIDRADVEDVAHEVFIVLYRKLGVAPQPEALRSFLFQVARRVASNYRRGSRRHARKRVARLPEPTTPTPEEQLACREDLERFEGFLDALDDEARTVFLLAEVQGEPGRVVAERLGVKLHVAYTRIYAVRRRFKRAMEPRRDVAAWVFAPLAGLRDLVRTLVGWTLAAAAAAIALLVIAARGDDPAQRPMVQRLARVSADLAAVPRPRTADTPSFREPGPAVPPAPTARLPQDAVSLPSRTRSRRRAPVADSSAGGATSSTAEPLRLRPAPPPSAAAGPLDPAVIAATTPRPVRRPPRATPPVRRAGVRVGPFVDDGGEPLRNAPVRCRRRDELGFRHSCFDWDAAPPRTDGHGWVTLPSPRSGEYELVAFSDDAVSTTETELVVHINKT